MPFSIVVFRLLKVDGLTIFPFIFVQDKSLLNDKYLINHEMIHIRQQLELLVIPFYLLYLLNYLLNLIIYKNHNRAYRNIAFEREAYTHEYDLEYLRKRKFWSWVSQLL